MPRQQINRRCPFRRRNFLSIAAGAVASVAAGQTPMAGSAEIPVVHGSDDRNGQTHALGVSLLAYKVVTADSQGVLFVAEKLMHARGGTPLYRHLSQDAWFYVLEGEFLVEIGGVRRVLTAGDSALGPGRVPHRSLFIGKNTGKTLVSFAPAGKTESFFDRVASMGAMHGEDKALFAAHDMELLGPTLTS